MASQGMRAAAQALALGATTMKTGPRHDANQAARARTQQRLEDKRQRRIKGLEWLLSKKKLTQRHYKAGLRYGMLYRVANIEGTVPLKSCLAEVERLDGGAGGLPPLEIMGTAEWIAECRKELAEANGTFADDPDIKAMLECICAREDTPQEVLGAGWSVRDAEDLISSLRTTLQILARKWGI